MKIKLNIELTFKDDLLEDMLADLPMSIRYWGTLERTKRGALQVVETVSYPEDDPETPQPRHRVPPDWVARGLKFLAEREKPYHRLHELLRGEYDAESLDVLFQAGVLGDLVYG